jgi:hypothetical protein
MPLKAANTILEGIEQGPPAEIIRMPFPIYQCEAHSQGN